MLSPGLNKSGNPPDANASGVDASLAPETSNRTLTTEPDTLPKQSAPPVEHKRVVSQATARMSRSLELDRDSSGVVKNPTGSPKRLQPVPPPLHAPKSVPLQGPKPKRLDNSFVIATAIMPVKNESIHNYWVDDKALPKRTFHTVRRAINKKNPDEIILSYLKENGPESYLSELEAVACAFYRFIAPDQVTFTRAVYDEEKGNCYRGVLSDDIPDFKSLAQDPLKEEDLNVDHLAERNLFSVLDAFDDELRVLERRADTIDRRLKKLDEQEELCRARLKQLRQARVSANATELATLSAQFADITATKDKLFNECSEITRQQHELFVNLQNTQQVPRLEFERYRIVKGLAIGLTTSYVFAEDDLHQNNISKDGKRIDFDMSLWPILYEFKNIGIIDGALRSPSKNALVVSQYDLFHFPNLRDVTPYYWPTNAPSKLEIAREFAGKFVPVSTNAYTEKANAIYQKLEKNKVFRHHYFATLLRFILTKSEMYSNLAILYMGKERALQGVSVVEDMGKLMARRIQSFKDKILMIRDFATFVAEHGDAVFKQILAQFGAENKRNAEQVRQLDKEILQLETNSYALGEVNQSLLSRTPKSSAPPSPKTPGSSESTIDVSQPFVLSIDDEYHVTEPKTADQKKLEAIRAQQERDKEKLQQDEISSNEAKQKKIVEELDRKRIVRVIYDRQQVNLDYLATMFDVVRDRLKNLPLAAEMTQDTPRSLPRSVSNSRPPLEHKTSIEPENAPPVTPVVVQPQATSSLFSSLPSLNFNISFGFAKASTPVPAPTPLKPNDYVAVRDIVVKAMEDYKNPGITGFGGTWRTQVALADVIIGECKRLNPKPEDVNDNAEAIARLKSWLLAKKAPLTSGTMFTTLTTLMNHEIWKINEPASQNLASPQGLP